MTDLIVSISFHELCQYEELSEYIILEVVDHGIAEPVSGKNAPDWVFDTNTVHWLRKAVRLHSQLEIDWVAVAMIIELLKRNESLEREHRCLEQKLKRFLE